MRRRYHAPDISTYRIIRRGNDSKIICRLLSWNIDPASLLIQSRQTHMLTKHSCSIFMVCCYVYRNGACTVPVYVVDNLSDVSVIFVETDNSRSRAKAWGIREYIAYVDTREQIKRWINKCVWLVRVQFFKRPALPRASHCYFTGRVLFVNRTRRIYRSNFNSTAMFTFANIYNAYQILPYVVLSGYIHFHRPRNHRIMYSVSLLQCHGPSM